MTEPTWLSYEYSRPQQDLPIIIECRGRDRNYEIVLVPRDLPPELNVANLRWRPTGIFKEMGDTITNYAGQVENAQGSGFMGACLSGLLKSQAGLGVSVWAENALSNPQKSREEYGPNDYPGEKLKWL